MTSRYAFILVSSKFVCVCICTLPSASVVMLFTAAGPMAPDDLAITWI